MYPYNIYNMDYEQVKIQQNMPSSSETDNQNEPIENEPDIQIPMPEQPFSKQPIPSSNNNTNNNNEEISPPDNSFPEQNPESTENLTEPIPKRNGQAPPISEMPLRRRPMPPVSNKYILEILKEAIKDEANDADYYWNLSNKMSSQEDKDILRKIRTDELKHNKMFKDIYYQITGERIDSNAESKKISNDVVSEIENSIFNELDTVEFYRKLMFAFLNLEIRDMLYEIITDEQAHAQKLNYLYAKYR